MSLGVGKIVTIVACLALKTATSQLLFPPTLSSYKFSLWLDSSLLLTTIFLIPYSNSAKGTAMSALRPLLPENNSVEHA